MDGLRPKEKWEAAWLSVLPKRHKLNIDWRAVEAINLKPLRAESISFIVGQTSSLISAVGIDALLFRAALPWVCCVGGWARAVENIGQMKRNFSSLSLTHTGHVTSGARRARSKNRKVCGPARSAHTGQSDLHEMKFSPPTPACRNSTGDETHSINYSREPRCPAPTDTGRKRESGLLLCVGEIGGVFLLQFYDNFLKKRIKVEEQRRQPKFAMWLFASFL